MYRMKKLSAPTNVEKVSGGLPMEVAGTLLGALHGGPIAPLLPILAKALASKRQQRRVEAFLEEVGCALEQHEQLLTDLTDSQYKIINEAVAAAFQTTHDEKLRVLQRAVANALHAVDISDQDAIVLSRTIRDISAEEAKFVTRTFRYKYIHISSTVNGTTKSKDVLTVSPDSPDAAIVGGLAALGVLTVGEPTYGQQLQFSRQTAKLIALLKDGGA